MNESDEKKIQEKKESEFKRKVEVAENEKKIK